MLEHQIHSYLEAYRYVLLLRRKNLFPNFQPQLN